ncbi:MULTISPECIES: DUF58 domain-containing protein [Methylomonas]|uniref:DUF58 domain-containing protein n=1 Tax=Methylomonas TaxID=416 RepID=UPI001E5E2883|nr:MxaS protein [Methylomonas rhizoryzae]
MTNEIAGFQYRLTHALPGVFPGAHPGQMLGAGQLFKRHEPLIANPDPRRIDLRASLLDPFGGYRVRVYQQPSQLTVYVIADLSASMGNKLTLVGDFVAAAAQSTYEYGDRFGFIGCGPSATPDWLVPACNLPHTLRKLAEQLRRYRVGGDARSLRSVAPLLPKRRSLIFLLSDFHFSLTELNALIPPLAGHALVPVVCWDPSEYATLPNWGLARLKDAETGRDRSVFLRPELKQRIEQAYQRRRVALGRRLRDFGREPLFLEGRYRSAPINRYFLQHAL